MAFNYIGTPRTEVGDQTNLTAANLSFSEVQPFGSPSKDPSNNLVQQLKSRNGAQALKTPRARNALNSLRNPGARNEFTPLLKSAAHNRFAQSSKRSRSIPEEKENTSEDIINSMLGAGPNGPPRTPAYLKPGYVDAQTPGLPINSSMLDGEHTGSSAGTPMPPPVASSSFMLSLIHI